MTLRSKIQIMQARVLTALLRGCRPIYDDYGHPERAGSRHYWTAALPPPYSAAWTKAYGYTHDDCCHNWLREMEHRENVEA